MCQKWTAFQFIKGITFSEPVLSTVLELEHLNYSAFSPPPQQHLTILFAACLASRRDLGTLMSLVHAVPLYVSPGLPRPLLSIWPTDNLCGKGLGAGEPLDFQRSWLLFNQHLPLQRSPSSTLQFSVTVCRTPLWLGRVLDFNPDKTKYEISNPSQNTMTSLYQPR